MSDTVFSLSTPCELLPQIKQRRSELFARLELRTLGDLLHYAPLRYEDRRHVRPLSAEIGEGEQITVRGVIQEASASPWGKVRLKIKVAPVPVRSTAEIVKAHWYGYCPFGIKQGLEIFLFGKVSREKKGGWLMKQPEYEIIHHDAESFIHLDRLAPIYGLKEGLTQRMMRWLFFQATQRTSFEAPEFYQAPAGYMSRVQAFRQLHFPGSQEEQEAARTRLAYDEFFTLQCVVAQRRGQRVQTHRRRRPGPQTLTAAWLKSVPFELTSAQRRVMGEIDCDLASNAPMNRLLQGDVGAGKTLVATYALLRAIEAGEQAALMAPTQILAEQHALNLRRSLEPLGVRVDLFTANRRSDLLQGGEIDLFQQRAKPSAIGSIAVGTQALLFNSYRAKQLGLIVIDEQHKFGVKQRLALSQKGQNPDVLVMTATPIPRTLGMTLYGDLDISVLDELPPGRRPIKTVRRAADNLGEFWTFLQKQVGEGRQAYVIYPLVDDSDKLEAKSVKGEFDRLRELLPGVRIGLMHGQLESGEKERVMHAFRAREIDVLLATTVVEVGVDVPNATIMLIENAERFGLAQLHQLRGRIGRGAHQSYCALVGNPMSLDSWKRLKTLEETNDGFRIAEEDFLIRGPGNIFGTEQSGLPPLRFGNPVRDQRLLQQAKKQADALIASDYTLSCYPVLKEHIERGWASVRSFISVG